MNLRSQRKLAAKVLKVGANRIRIASDAQEAVAEAITRDDIRELVGAKSITVKAKVSNSRGRIRKRISQKVKGRHRGAGKRKGSANSRNKDKRRWIIRIRTLRDELNKLKAKGILGGGLYRRLYRQAKGNLFHSRRHLREHIQRIQKS